MPKRSELPPALRAGPFSVAAARQNGVGKGRLRGLDLDAPFRGVRAHPIPSEPLAHTQVERAAAELRWVIGRCSTYAPLLRPGQFFSHLTAARLWGLPLPERFTAGELLHVSSPAPRRAPRSLGISGHSGPAGVAIVMRHGLPVSDPVTTWLACAALLHLDDLVALGDAIVLDPKVLDPRDIRPFATLDELAAGIAVFHGRGARLATRAHPLVRVGAESHRETLLRLLLGRGGLPEPELNGEIYDEAGRWIARGDLLYRRWKVLAEYDGDDHRRNTQAYERDIVRIERLIAAGWTVIRVRASGLGSGSAATVDRVRDALRARGWRDDASIGR